MNFLILLGIQLSAQSVQLNATSTVLANWNGGYTAQITITNPTTAPVSAWTANFGVQSGQTINCLWNGTFVQTNQNITVSNQTNNGTIAAGQSITFGFTTADPNNAGPTISALTSTGNATTPPGSGFALNASYQVTTVWATAYQVTVTLKNTTSTSSSSWTASFVMPQGETLSSYQTGGNFTVSGQTVTVTNLSSNGIIAPNGSTTFTMIIDKPSTGANTIGSLQAYANGGTPPVTLSTPVLQPISNPNGSSTYTVNWSSVTNAQNYVLQQSTSSSFSSPITVYSGSGTSFQITNNPTGTYYYKVTAQAGSVSSNPSNVVSTTVSQITPPPPVGAIEHSAWYIDWTSWFTGAFVIPSSNNMLNVFVGTLMFDANNNPTIGGFGNMTDAELTSFTSFCHSQNPPIKVKASIGGGGGSYDNCWDLLTTANVQAFAQGLANYCQAHGLDGIDFDYEEYASAAQETLVGTLILNLKKINPNLQTSVCTNAGFPTWQSVIENIFNAAMIAPGNCAVDRLYIMSYYDPIASEEGWITSWANWVIPTYGFTPARISVGIDDFDAHAYDPVALANWAASQGYSTAHWAFDPAHPVTTPY